MPCRIFHISNSVHDVSCRNYIMALLLQEGFDKGSAINTEDETGRKMVEIRVSGEDEKIYGFLPKLNKELSKEFEGHIEISEIRKGNGDSSDAPDIMRSSQAHLLFQFKKATDVLSDMKESLNEKLDKIDRRFEELPMAIARAMKEN